MDAFGVLAADGSGAGEPPGGSRRGLRPSAPHASTPRSPGPRSETPSPGPGNDIHDGASRDSPTGSAPSPDGDFTRPEEDPRPPASRVRIERLGERTEDFVDSVESAIGKAVPERVMERSDPRHNTVFNVIWRALVLVAGLTLVLVGIVLLVAPGPGWGSILLGLAILASEFTWANRLLGPVRRRVRAETARVRRFSRRQRIALYAVTLLASAAAIAWYWWYVATYGWTLPWTG